MIARGEDPGVARKAEKAAQVAEGENTFETVAREWFKRFRAVTGESNRFFLDASRAKVLGRQAGDLLAKRLQLVVVRVSSRIIDSRMTNARVSRKNSGGLLGLMLNFRDF
ncbi:hypothetical protein GMST_23900 [Geomonas silvestris]|uniref:Uncharacterized protein n=2 Tax=Geomonas silvestris TaxID=2740184 RepID=A0A6V8MJ67_9BACT|nr:hypothetical protein GMST_23900 [Geomonas silvestris]